MESVRSRQTAIDITIIVALRPGINPLPRREPPIPPLCRYNRRKSLIHQDFLLSDGYPTRHRPGRMGSEIPGIGADPCSLR
jgi:hypothetical protein